MLILILCLLFQLGLDIQWGMKDALNQIVEIKVEFMS